MKYSSKYIVAKQDWKDFQSSRLHIDWQYLLNLIKIWNNCKGSFIYYVSKESGWVV